MSDGKRKPKRSDEPTRRFAEPADPHLGRELGGCKVERVLGKGGMATVYLARQASGEAVAIKVLDPKRCKNVKEVRQFVQEGKTLARLQHRHIVRVFGVGEQDQTHFLLMEVVEGGSVYDVLKQDGRFDVERAIKYTRQIAEALNKAHTSGVVHRDVKPHNVLVTGNDQLKLTDFGLAALVDGSGGAFGSTKVVGTPHYMSPEQVDALPVDARTDIYALGASLYHMATGTTPFTGKTVVDLLLKQVSEPVEPPEARCPEVPPWLSSLILKALAKEPGDRYEDCAELLRALELRGKPDPKQAAKTAKVAPERPSRQANLFLSSAPPPPLERPRGVARASRLPAIAMGIWLLSALALGAVGQGAVRTLLSPPPLEAAALIEGQASFQLAKLKRSLETAEVEATPEAQRESLLDFASSYAGTSAAVKAASEASAIGKEIAAARAKDLSETLARAEALVTARELGQALDLLDALEGRVRDGASEETLQSLRAQRAKIEVDLSARGLVWLPPGEVVLGSGARAKKRFVAGVYVQRREVSNADFAAYVRGGGGKAPPAWKGDSPPAGAGKLPVTGVTYAQAAGYAEWRGMRLVKGSEWEKAARGPKQLDWPWGNEWDAKACVWGPEAKLRAVDEPGRDLSGYGVEHLAGNARELALAPGSQPGRPLLELRGGGVGTSHPENTRASFFLDGVAAGDAHPSVGFRCAAETLPEAP